MVPGSIEEIRMVMGRLHSAEQSIDVLKENIATGLHYWSFRSTNLTAAAAGCFGCLLLLTGDQTELHEPAHAGLANSERFLFLLDRADVADWQFLPGSRAYLLVGNGTAGDAFDLFEIYRQSWALDVFFNFFNNKKKDFFHFLSS